MARIVSGFQTQGGEWDGGAILRGYKSGQEARLNEEQNRRANEGLEMERMRLQFSIQQALQEQMKAEAAVQEQAKAGKLQQFAMRAQSGQAQPGQKIVDRIIGARGRLKDPKALAMFDESVSSLLKSQKEAQESKAFSQAFSKAQKDTKVFTPEFLQGIDERLRGGESKKALMDELHKERLAVSERKRARTENEKELAEAFALVESQPEGWGKRQAWIALDAIASSDSEMDTPGAGAKAKKVANEALLGPRSEYGQGKGDPYADRLLFAEAYNQLADEGALPIGDEEGIKEAVRARMRMMNSDLPPPQAEYAERVPVMKIHALVGQSLQSGADAKGVAEALQQAGIPLTENTLQLVRSAMTQYTDNARLQAVAQRERR